MKLKCFPRKYFLALLSLLFGTSLLSGDTTDDPLKVLLSAKDWRLGAPGAKSPVATKIDGVACLQFPALFLTNTSRAAWDKTLSADLSGASAIRFKYKVSDHRKIGQFTVYLKSGTGYYFRDFAALPVRSDDWTEVVIPRAWFYSTEGKVQGWGAIDGIRLSPWQSEPGPFSFYLADVSLVKAVSGENILANSGFETCTLETFPDFWGPGHWGLGAPNWVANTPEWRKRWTVVKDEHHSGNSSLRIVGDTNTAGLRCVSTRFILNVGREYVFSAWLKSDLAGGLPVSLVVDGLATSNTTVGRQWQRHAFAFTEKNWSPRMCRIIPQGHGTLWIDDIQLEEGRESSEWKAAPVDAWKPVATPLPRDTTFTPPVIQPLPSVVVVSRDEHRRILVNGKPFIPFATGWESPPTPDVIRDSALGGFNAICWTTSSNTSFEKQRLLLDTAASNGLMSIVWFHRNVSTSLLREHLIQFKNHPSVLAWYIYDEPSAITPEILEKYDLARSLDPARLAYINYVLYPENKLGDIASMDMYPIPENSPAMMAGLARTLEFSASRSGKPSWIWIQGCGYAYFKSREPSGAEAECMTYCSLIGGVRGIKWFAQKPLSAELWNRMGSLGSEIRVLTPALSSVEKSPPIASDSKNIEWVSKKIDSELFLIAVNTQPFTVKASFTLPANIQENAEVLFENRRITTPGSKLQDAFLGWERHVYRLRIKP